MIAEKSLIRFATADDDFNLLLGVLITSILLKDNGSFSPRMSLFACVLVFKNVCFLLEVEMLSGLPLRSSDAPSRILLSVLFNLRLNFPLPILKVNTLL